MELEGYFEFILSFALVLVVSSAGGEIAERLRKLR